MEGKTLVRVKQKFRDSDLEVGDEGYIDGYTTGARGIPVAVLVIKDRLGVSPMYCLKVIKEFTNTNKVINEGTTELGRS